jgi:hypothetical protein
MKYLGTIAVFVAAALAALGANLPTDARADGTPKNDLSTQCQAMAFDAHPASLPDSSSVANLRHSYYALCIDRQGIMDPELNNQ